MNGCMIPIENAFDLAGQYQSANILRAFFVEAFGGKVLFLLGGVLACIRMLRGQGTRAIFLYMAVVFSCWGLFVLPRGVVPVPAAVKEGSIQEQTSGGILKSLGIEQLTVNPVLHSTGMLLNVICNGAVGIIQQGEFEGKVIEEPFSGARAGSRLGDRIARGITDRGLHLQTILFYQDDFFPAIAELVGKKDDGSFWPGDTNVVSIYSQKGAANWDAIREMLVTGLDGDGLVTETGRLLYQGRMIKDDALRALLASDLRRERMTYVTAGKNPDVAAGSGQWVSRAALGVLSGKAFLYGALLWVVWVLFPLVISVLVLTAEMGVLWGWMKIFVGIKLFPVVWAVGDRVWQVAFLMASGTGPSMRWVWEMPGLGMAAAIEVVLLPALLILVLGVISGKKGGGHEALVTKG